MSKKIAMYAGSFDPLTLGHVDIIKRAIPLFDELVICISNSTSKTYLFSLEERQQLVKECFNQDNVKVIANDGLTAKVAKEYGAKYMVRGIRTYMDMEYEKSMDTMNRSLFPEMETLFFFASSHLANVSSTLVKEVAILRGNVNSFVPPNVLKALLQKVGNYEIK